MPADSRRFLGFGHWAGGGDQIARQRAGEEAQRLGDGDRAAT
jgi:hypothetical protein